MNQYELSCLGSRTQVLTSVQYCNMVNWRHAVMYPKDTFSIYSLSSDALPTNEQDEIARLRFEELYAHFGGGANSEAERDKCRRSLKYLACMEAFPVCPSDSTTASGVSALPVCRSQCKQAMLVCDSVPYSSYSSYSHSAPASSSSSSSSSSSLVSMLTPTVDETAIDAPTQPILSAPSHKLRRGIYQSESQTKEQTTPSESLGFGSLLHQPNNPFISFSESSEFGSLSEDTAVSGVLKNHAPLRSVPAIDAAAAAETSVETSADMSVGIGWGVVENGGSCALYRETSCSLYLPQGYFMVAPNEGPYYYMSTFYLALLLIWCSVSVIFGYLAYHKHLRSSIQICRVLSAIPPIKAVVVGMILFFWLDCDSFGGFCHDAVHTAVISLQLVYESALVFAALAIAKGWSISYHRLYTNEWRDLICWTVFFYVFSFLIVIFFETADQNSVGGSEKSANGGGNASSYWIPVVVAYGFIYFQILFMTWQEIARWYSQNKRLQISNTTSTIALNSAQRNRSSTRANPSRSRSSTSGSSRQGTAAAAAVGSTVDDDDVDGYDDDGDQGGGGGGGGDGNRSNSPARRLSNPLPTSSTRAGTAAAAAARSRGHVLIAQDEGELEEERDIEGDRERERRRGGGDRRERMHIGRSDRENDGYASALSDLDEQQQHHREQQREEDEFVSSRRNRGSFISSTWTTQSAAFHAFYNRNYQLIPQFLGISSEISTNRARRRNEITDAVEEKLYFYVIFLFVIAAGFTIEIVTIVLYFTVDNLQVTALFILYELVQLLLLGVTGYLLRPRVFSPWFFIEPVVSFSARRTNNRPPPIIEVGAFPLTQLNISKDNQQKNHRINFDFSYPQAEGDIELSEMTAERSTNSVGDFSGAADVQSVNLIFDQEIELDNFFSLTAIPGREREGRNENVTGVRRMIVVERLLRGTFETVSALHESQNQRQNPIVVPKTDRSHTREVSFGVFKSEEFLSEKRAVVFAVAGGSQRGRGLERGREGRRRRRRRRGGGEWERRAAAREVEAVGEVYGLLDNNSRRGRERQIEGERERERNVSEAVIAGVRVVGADYSHVGATIQSPPVTTSTSTTPPSPRTQLNNNNIINNNNINNNSSSSIFGLARARVAPSN